MDALNDRGAEDRPQGQKSADVHRRANEGGRNKTRVGDLKQTASDHSSVAQSRCSTPDRDADPAAAREQRLGAGELFWPKVHVATEALDQGTPATTHYGIQSAGSDPRSHRQCQVEQYESWQRTVRRGAGEYDQEVGGDRKRYAYLLDDHDQKDGTKTVLG